MFRLSHLLLAVALLPAVAARAHDSSSERRHAAVAGERLLAPGAIDVVKLLPPPPAPESPAGRADLETVLQVQAARTPEQVAWARAVEADGLFSNAAVLGAWFQEANLPATAKFFSRVEDEIGALGVKKFFNRRRPPYADPRVQPCVKINETSSYPSGHAWRAWLWAGLLGEMFPEARAALAERARSVCWARVVGGAHFPSDTAAGRALAEALVAELLKNPAVRAELARCRAEAEPFWLKKAA